MKKIIYLVLAGLVIWGISAWVSVTNSSGWKVAGLIIGGILAVALVALLFKAIIQFIKWAFTSCVYLTFATATIVLLTIKSVIPMVWGMSLSVLFAWLLAVMVIRYIGNRSQSSAIMGEIFGWLTGFGITKTDKLKVAKSKSVKERVPEPEEKENENACDEDVYKALLGMNYSVKEAKEAYNYAMEQQPDGDWEEKVKCALAYLGSNKVLSSIS